MLPGPEELAQINADFENSSAEDILAWTWKSMGPRAAFGTSFQGAGLVAIDLAYKNGFTFPVFTIDTGFLFRETLDLKKRTEDRYGITIESLHPEQSVEEQARVHGDKLWERDPDSCCWYRKVEPLKRKLSTLEGWITGLRRTQAETRTGTGFVELYEFDPIFNKDILKINPMANWTKEEVWNYIYREKIPYNALHDQGYASIGCQPCTRPAGEAGGERAGRWTGFSKTECGIHTFMQKKV